MARDPELTQILLQELGRHLVALDELGLAPDPEALGDARRTVHALKGSAGLAGEAELAATMARLERRLRDGDPDALGATVEAVRHAIERLELGERTAGAWPLPPPDLAPGAVDPGIRTQYVAELSDRLARIDEALASEQPPEEAAADVFRHLHTMKGAASAVGDEPMAWFCHGLEERLKLRPSVLAGIDDASARAALTEMATWRVLLGSILEDPTLALAKLRGEPRRATSSRPKLSATPRAPGVAEHEEGTIRVSTQSVDRLLDHASGMAVARERVAARSTGAVEHARALRRLRSELAEALRLIGPPRPWGAPAAALRRIERVSQTLVDIGDELDLVAERLKVTDQALKDDTGAAKKILTAMRQTPIRGLFARLAAAAHAEARRTGRVVDVRTSGSDEPVDRRLIESLVEPCLQITRNAIAHGIEPPDVREANGKPRAAVLSLRASRSGNRLTIAIEDDGAGVDVAQVRERAIETGTITEVLAEAADDRTLLELLFLPGFSLREQSPDLLAGRGIGLDITLASVQKLGGTVRLSSRQGHGLEARVDVPYESGLLTVLWVVAEGIELAIPAASAVRVRSPAPEDERVPHLASCLEPRAVSTPAYLLDLDALDGSPSFAVGVDAVGGTEEVLLRQLSPLLVGIGPYTGAIVRGDGSLRLALDVHALAPRVRALGRVADAPPSRPPGARRRS